MALEDLIGLDQWVLLRMNGSDSLFFDYLMGGITSTVAWIPAAVVLLYVLVKNNSMREVWLVVLFLALSVLMADQFSSSFCKPYFARFRPAQDPALMYVVDVVDGYRGGLYGFISSHAANTFAVCVFLAFTIRNARTTLSLILWALSCSYSRVYLGVHYPGDILCGMLWGVFVGFSAYAAYAYLLRKMMSPTKKFISTQYTSTGYAVADLDVFLTALYLTFVVLAVRAVMSF